MILGGKVQTLIEDLPKLLSEKTVSNTRVKKTSRTDG